MRKSRFSNSQIMAILKKAGSRRAGLRDLSGERYRHCTALFYQWRSKYGGMDVSMMSRMKELEAENARLKKMYAEERLKAEIVQEALGKSGKAISPQRDGTTLRHRTKTDDSAGVPGVSDQRNLLPIRAQAL